MSASPSQLIEVLSLVKQRLESSQESDWTSFSPADVIAILDRELESLRSTSRLADATELQFLFGPTAPIQEISMANNWSQEFLMLSKRFDDLVDS
jgi:hypothetical protein